MDFNEYQTRAMETRHNPESTHPIIMWALGLGGESGEVLDKVKKIFRDRDGEYTLADMHAIKSELGDVLWYVTALADSLSISLNDVALQNLIKLRDRQSRGVIQGEGDER